MSEPELSGPKFVELMERYRVRPSELGITSAYKTQLKKGLRKPSTELIKRLLRLIRERGASSWRRDPDLEGLRGLADPTAPPTRPA